MNQYRQFFHFILLSVAIFTSYSNTFQQGFYFDDIPNIEKEKNIRLVKLSWEDIKKTFFFSYGHEGDGKLDRPVSRFSFALNYYYSQYDTTSYHFTNILIHIIAACTLYLLFQTILLIYCSSLPPPHPVANYSKKHINDIALLAAFLWALHPIQTSAVTYIVQRMASMAGMFYFGAFYLYLKGRLAPLKSKQQFTFFSFACIIWILAILSKENAVLLPLSIILFESLFFPISRKKVFGILSLLFLLVLFSIAALFLLRDNSEPFDFFVKNYSQRPFNLPERLLTESRIIIKYISSLLLPLANNLSLERGLEISKGLFSPPSTFWSTVVILFFIILSFIIRRRYVFLSFAILYFFANHLVESTVIPLELYFEHRNYIPSAFVFLVIALVFHFFFYRYTFEKHIVRYLVIICIATYLLCSCISTWLRNDVWRTELSLHTDSTLKTEINVRPYVTVGIQYMRQGKYDKAQKYFKKAENIYKKFPQEQLANQVGLLYYNAGILHMRQKHYDKAKKLFLKSLRYIPGYTDALANIGYLCFLDEDLACTKKAFKTALKFERKMYYFASLGRVSFDENDIEQAISYFQEGLLLENKNILKYNLIACFLYKEHFNDARKHFYTIYPSNNNDIAYNLYGALLHEGLQREKYIDRLVTIIILESPGLLEWMDSIQNQNHILVIPPDISAIEESITQEYIKRITEQTKTLDTIIKDIDLTFQDS